MSPQNENEIAITSAEYARLWRIIGETNDFPTAWEKQGENLVITTAHISWDSRSEEYEKRECEEKVIVPFLVIVADEYLDAYIAYQNLKHDQELYARRSKDLEAEKQKVQELTKEFQSLSQEPSIDTFKIECITHALDEIRWRNTAEFVEKLERSLQNAVEIEGRYERLFQVKIKK